VDSRAGLQLAFEFASAAANGEVSCRRSSTPKRGKSASPGRAGQQQNGGGGGDFSRADSYENFDRPEGAGIVLP